MTMTQDTRTEVFEFLKAAILELKDIDSSAITADTLLETIQLDSLDYVDIQVNIRKTYRVEVVAELFTSGKVRTLGELVD